MQREIKFRAWDKETSSIVDVIFLSFRLNKIKVTHWQYGDSMLSDLEDFDLMQFTGLKDMNGIDVFEGDILKFRNIFDNQGYFKKAVVTFENGAFECNYSLLKRYTKNTFEVVGNVYENPELLEAK